MRITGSLQRRILALLEEAGEEDLASLINTVAKPSGSPNELDAMTKALIELLNTRLVEVATSRDSKSLCWTALPGKSAISILRDLKDFVEWSANDMLWKWNKDLPRAEILLTNLGNAMAHQVLSQDGWPEEPLDRYE